MEREQRRHGVTDLLRNRGVRPGEHERVGEALKTSRLPVRERSILRGVEVQVATVARPSEVRGDGVRGLTAEEAPVVRRATALASRIALANLLQALGRNGLWKDIPVATGRDSAREH